MAVDQSAQWVAVPDAIHLKEGESLGVRLDGTQRDVAFLIRLKGDLLAYRNSCPHIPGAPLAWRRHTYLNKDATRIVCSGHDAWFELEDGRCIKGPCKGEALEPLAVKCSGDSDVFIKL